MESLAGRLWGISFRFPAMAWLDPSVQGPGSSNTGSSGCPFPADDPDFVIGQHQRCGMGGEDPGIYAGESPPRNDEAAEGIAGFAARIAGGAVRL